MGCCYSDLNNANQGPG